MNLEVFTKIPNDLLTCQGFVSKTKTGEAKYVPLIASHKLVLVYMVSRTKYFVEQVKKGGHYESQESIGKACGIEYKAAGRALRMFVENGVITAKKGFISGRNNKQWIYTDVDTSIKLWVKEDGEFIVFEGKVPKHHFDLTHKGDASVCVETPISGGELSQESSYSEYEAFIDYEDDPFSTCYYSEQVY